MRLKCKLTLSIPILSFISSNFCQGPPVLWHLMCRRGACGQLITKPFRDRISDNRPICSANVAHRTRVSDQKYRGVLGKTKRASRKSESFVLQSRGIESFALTQVRCWNWQRLRLGAGRQAYWAQDRSRTQSHVNPVNLIPGEFHATPQQIASGDGFPSKGFSDFVKISAAPGKHIGQCNVLSRTGGSGDCLGIELPASPPGQTGPNQCR